MAKKKPIQEEPEIQAQSSKPGSNIEPELKRFEKQVNELLKVLESVDLMTIDDMEDRLKAAQAKLKIQLDLPKVLSALDDLRNKAKLRAEDVKGNKSLSPLEDGTLDDD